MNSAEFRKELVKVMPGYNWTVQRPDKRTDMITGRQMLCATGTQSRGFNRLSTLRVERRDEEGKQVLYKAMIADYGTRSPWAFTGHGSTLAQALRDVQQQCEREANRCRSMGARMQDGRAQNPEKHQPSAPEAS